MTWVIYDPTTGEIVRAVSCSPDMLEANLRDDEVAIEADGKSNGGCFYVADPLGTPVITRRFDPETGVDRLAEQIAALTAP